MRTLLALALVAALAGCSTLGGMVHAHCEKPLAERLLKREALAITTAPHRVAIHCYADG